MANEKVCCERFLNHQGRNTKVNERANLRVCMLLDLRVSAFVFESNFICHGFN